MAHSRRNVGRKNQPNRPPATSKQSDRDRPAPGLYLVATPIGNLRDITLRALDILGAADIVYCEDTRVTGKLFAAHDIATPLASYHEHNAGQMRPKIIKRLEDGEVVALVSDAGTPLISDPGFKLVSVCRDRALPVTAIPGPSALVAALVVSGLPTDRFHFVGFLPPRGPQRRRALGEVSRLRATLVVYETGARVAKLMADMAEILGPRSAAIARELTKLHEEVRGGTLAELAEALAEESAPKGELVVVVGSPENVAASDIDLDAELRRSLATLSLRDAVAEVASVTGLPRRQVYARALALAPAVGKLRSMP